MANCPRTRLNSFFTLIAALCFAQALQAQNAIKPEGPSLEETETWIKQTYSEGSHIVFQTRSELKFWSLDKEDQRQCWVYFEGFDIASQQMRFIQAANLADIDPTSIKAGELVHDTDITTVKDPDQIDFSTYAVKDHPYVWVSIKTTNSNDSIKSKTKIVQNGKSTDLPGKDKEIGFSGRGIALKPEYAPRFMKALTHAVEICGGKPSAF